jgi:hypothetical protein
MTFEDLDKICVHQIFCKFYEFGIPTHEVPEKINVGI